MSFFANNPWTGNIGESVPATNIVETTDKQFISQDLKNQIQSNAVEIENKIDKDSIGVAGGIAQLNAEGQVVNADGTVVSGSTSSVQWGSF